MKIRNLKLKCLKCAVLTAISLIFISMNMITYQSFHSSSFSDYLLKSLKGPLLSDDPILLQYIKDKFLEEPSKEPYNVISHVQIAVNKMKSEKFYQKYIKIIFENKRGGFFLEAGALDGQTMSNTLQLEMKQGWTGLLVEPNPSSYTLLKQKHRKAWTVNACLSIDKFPRREKFWGRDVTLNNHVFIDVKHKAMGSLIQDNDDHNKYSEEENVSQIHYFAQCFPLESLLLALNVSRVDLFSLDVEFVEEKILTNFNFDKFDIQVLFIEWWEKNTVQWLNNFLTTKGFTFVANIRSDIIFVKKGSEYDEILKKKIPKRVFQIYEEIPIPQNSSKPQPKLKLNRKNYFKIYN